MSTVLSRILRGFRSRHSAPTPGIETHYFRLATQYYAVARWAVFTISGTVVGNLFHHAIELYLKGALSRDLSRRRLTRYGHNLKRLWKAYKAKHPSSALSAFDTVVSNLHKFETIRYPDAIAAKGMFFALPLSRPDPPLSFSQGGASPPTYYLVVNDVDALVKVFFATESLNPDFFFGQLGSEGQAVIHRDNPSFGTG